MQDQSSRLAQVVHGLKAGHLRRYYVLACAEVGHYVERAEILLFDRQVQVVLDSAVFAIEVPHDAISAKKVHPRLDTMQLALRQFDWRIGKVKSPPLAPQGRVRIVSRASPESLIPKECPAASSQRCALTNGLLEHGEAMMLFTDCHAVLPC